MTECNGSAPQTSPTVEPPTIVLQEDGDRLILGVSVPLQGELSEEEFDLAQLMFALALDIRVRMGRVL